MAKLNALNSFLIYVDRSIVALSITVSLFTLSLHTEELIVGSLVATKNILFRVNDKIATDISLISHK